MRLLLKIRPAFLFIFCATLFLSVKATEIWSGLIGGGSPIAVGPAVAQEANGEGAEQPLDTNKAKNPEKPGGSASDLARELEQQRDGQPDRQPLALRQGQGLSDPQGFTAAEIELLQGLSLRREAIERREKELVLQEGMLAAAEQRITLKIEELKKLQNSIRALLRQRDEEEEAQLRRLVKIYETMKPANAARIFEELDLPILLDVFEGMREAKAAPVLAVMAPGRAKIVTTELAERRQLPEAGN